MAYDDYLKAQKLALKAYKNKTVADLVDKVNDDSVQMTMEDILTALGINADEQQEIFH